MRSPSRLLRRFLLPRPVGASRRRVGEGGHGRRGRLRPPAGLGALAGLASRPPGPGPAAEPGLRTSASAVPPSVGAGTGRRRAPRAGLGGVLSPLRRSPGNPSARESASAGSRPRRLGRGPPSPPTPAPPPPPTNEPSLQRHCGRGKNETPFFPLPLRTRPRRLTEGPQPVTLRGDAGSLSGLNLPTAARSPKAARPARRPTPVPVPGALPTAVARDARAARPRVLPPLRPTPVDPFLTRAESRRADSPRGQDQPLCASAGDCRAASPTSPEARRPKANQPQHGFTLHGPHPARQVNPETGGARTG